MAQALDHYSLHYSKHLGCCRFHHNLCPMQPCCGAVESVPLPSDQLLEEICADHLLLHPQWYVLEYLASCHLNRTRTQTSHAAISAFTNIAFAVYPGFMIWGLHMPTRKKLNTMALMGLGLA